MKQSLFLCLLLLSCSLDSDVNKGANVSLIITLDRSVDINIPEPSGLCYDGKYLWSVSDQNNTIYKLSISGNIIESFNHIGVYSLEGITFNPNNSHLYIAEEDNRTIIECDTNGVIIHSEQIFKDFIDNSGFEGIMYDPSKNHLIVLKEKNKGKIYTIDLNFTVIKEEVLKFASDYSGISDYKNNSYLIISDKDSRVYQYKNGIIIAEVEIPFKKAEGIVYVEQTNTLYIVSDLTKKLYIYTIEL